MSSGSLPDGALWAVVCDGMGGANGGNVASSKAAEYISEHLQSSYREGMNSNSIKALLNTVIYNANAAVYEMSQNDPTLIGMGTTVVLVLVVNNTVYISHAGDSRAYLITKDNIIQLTTDHSIVQELIDKGELSETEARRHPQKNIITRALGVEPSIVTDYNEHEVQDEDMILLCTDGLTNYLSSDQIFQLSKEIPTDCLADKLVAHAIDDGGADNITVVLIGQ
jgi:protein phosphatase